MECVLIRHPGARWRLLGAMVVLASCAAPDAGEPPAETDPQEAAPLAQPGDDLGAFRRESRKDPMTDAEESYIMSPDVRGPESAFRRAGLVWRCDGVDLETLIVADDFLTSTRPVGVQLRFDEATAGGPTDWAVSTEGTAVFAPDRESVALTEAALGAERLRARLTDFRGTDHDYEFRLEGLATALATLPCDLSRARSRIAAAERTADARREEERLAAEAEARAAAFSKTWQWVGNHNSKTYLTTQGRCWRAHVDSATAAFFRTEQEARAAGFVRAALCR